MISNATRLLIAILITTGISSELIAEKNNKDLDILFYHLKTSKHPKVIEKQIWNKWNKHLNPNVNKVMNDSVKFLYSGNHLSAVAGFTKIFRLNE